MLAYQEHIPSVSEELNRKTSEELIRIMNRVQSGELPRHIAYEALVSTFNAVSGLVDKDIHELFEQILLTIQQRSNRVQRTLHYKGNRIVMLSQSLIKPQLCLTRLNYIGRTFRTFDTQQEAAQHLQRIEATLLNKGYLLLQEVKG
jgi:hypothetical protein